MLSGTPDSRAWQPKAGVLSGLSSQELAAAAIATNQVGDTVIIYEKSDGTTYTLNALRYTVIDGWSLAEAISLSSQPHLDVVAAVSGNRDILAIWRQTDGTRHHLWSSRYTAADNWSLPTLAEKYNGSYSGGTEYDDGDVLSTHYLGFSDEGVAFACWRQHKTVYYRRSSSALYFYHNNRTSQASFFYPNKGWTDAFAAEDDQTQIGHVEDVNCGISSDGNALIAIQKYANYAPCFNCGGFPAEEIFVRPFDPLGGWGALNTVDFLMDGIKDDVKEQDIGSFSPSVALSGQDSAIVAWREEANLGIHSLRYTFNTKLWSGFYTHESRSNQIPTRVEPLARMNRPGDGYVSWDSKYQTILAEDSSWARASNLLAGVTEIELDSNGIPVVAGSSGTDIFAAKVSGRSWVTQQLDSPTTEVVTVKDATVDLADNVIVYWGRGGGVFVSEEVPPYVAPPGNLPPVANAGSNQTVLEGAAVQLNGSGSTDADGVITAYLWQQTGGAAVTLVDANSTIATFNAPLVDVDETLSFQLTVTDDQGASASAVVTVTVQNDGPDVVAPVTTFATQTKIVKGKQQHTVSLTVNEPATTYFRFSGQGAITGGGSATTNWQTYTVPVVILLDKNGSGSFDFYSEDVAANIEATRTEVLQ